MDIYLTKDGKSIGPYTADELREKIKSGDVASDESAWSSETGDWKRLEIVLKKADELASSGRKKSKLGKAPAPAPDAKKSEDKESDDSPERQRSSKLRPPGAPPLGAEEEDAEPAKRKKGGLFSKKKKTQDVEDSGGGMGGIRALPSAEQKQKDAKSRGGAGGERVNPLRFLRWAGLLAFAVFLFSLFAPWVTTTFGDSQTDFNAVAVVKAGKSDIAMPGTSMTPKHFRTSKIVLIAAVVVVLLVGIISLINAVSSEADSSGLGILLVVIGIGCLIGFGVLQGRMMEGQFNRALERMALERGGGGAVDTIEFNMSVGYYLGIAALVLMAAFLALPQNLFGSIGSAHAPAVILMVIGAGLAIFGLKQMGGSRILDDAFDSMRAIGEEVGGAVRSKADKASPPEIPAGTTGGASADPFAPPQ